MYEAPAFDALTGGDHPFQGFGAVLRAEAPNSLDAVVAEAHGRVHDVFTMSVSPDRNGIVQLDAMVRGMWRTGWEPGSHDLELFVRDFGSLFTQALRSELGGLLLLRSASDLSHASLWWSAERVEFFPFHKMLKALCHHDGEGLVFSLDGLSSMLSGRQ